MQNSQSYESISRRSLDFEDYLDIARRHVGWIIGPLFAGAVISCFIAFLLPNVYVSQASMRITPAQIPESLAPSVLNQQMADRINQMQQEILSRTSLSELIQRPNLNLYKRERDRKPLEDVIEQMRTKDIKINLINLAGQGNRPASAFSISFAYPDRFKSQAVVAALVSKFSDANVSTQRIQGTVTKDFLTDELSQSKENLDRLDAELTKFRVENFGRLPEEAQMNVQALNALQNQRASLDEALNRNNQEKMLLDTKIDTLKSQYDSMAASVPQNEDAASLTHNERLVQLNRLIAENESKLNSMKQIYTANYPDIATLSDQVNAWKKEREGLQKEEDKQQQEAKLSKTPVKRVMSATTTRILGDLQANIDNTKALERAVDQDSKDRLKQINAVNAQLAGYQARLVGGPANEQRYAQLIADRETASQKYQELKKKQSVAQQNIDITQRKAGENLEVLDNPSLPESPTAPNRWLISGIGVAIGLLGGVFMAGFKEMKDTSLKNLKDVRAYTQLPILSSIPLLENDLLVQRNRRVAYLSWSAAVIIGILAVSASMYYHFFLRS